MEGKATLTIVSNADETLNVSVDFDPPIKNEPGEEDENPLCHHAVILAFQAVTEWAAQ